MQTGWSVVTTHPTQGRTFQRPLNGSEFGFFWDGQFNGSTDNLHHVHLRLSNGTRDGRLFSKDNVVKAWLSTKRRYPIMAATVQGRGLDIETLAKSKVEDDDAWELYYVVQESNLSIVHPNEIIFGEVANEEEARKQVTAILDGPRSLSADLLAQLYVFRENNFDDVLHLMTLVAHGITDGTSNRTLARCLLDTLARGGGPNAEPPQLPLEERLAMSISFTELEPMQIRSLSLARRRWRKAMAAVISDIRMRKSLGSHTLPRFSLRGSSYEAPTRPGYVSASLTPAQSASVIAKCRQHKVTFGNTYTVLAQVAMTRVIYRRYLRGEISKEEWDHRKKAPHVSIGPINMRPYLDKTWFEEGGGGEFMMSVSIYIYKLPFMTLGEVDDRHCSRDKEHVRKLFTFSDGAPAFSDLLSFDRFLHRTRLVQNQVAEFVNHPLLHEIVQAVDVMYAKIQRSHVLQWIKAGQDHDENSDDIMRDSSVSWAPGGSSLGNIDKIFPLEYPLPSSDPLSPYSPVSHASKAGYVVPSTTSPDLELEAEGSPKIVVEHASSHLHPRPGELYLGAFTTRAQLNLFVFYDGSVFEEAVVKEWLGEVKDAMLWYLGR